ncbi:MAG: stage 0 sporulation family protein [Desulfovibrionales bacterium]
MGKILGLKFKEQGQVYFFQAAPFVIQEGDRVLVKTEEGLGLGSVVIIRQDVPEGLNPEQIKPIYRVATEEDLAADKENKELAGSAFSFCRECIRKRELNMKLVDVEVYFDRSKMIFYFTAPGRIDFRDLVKDLVRAYRTRIELRQIGVRHETQMLGGLGNCGQVCCCRRFLRRFEPVTIKMAKDQNLFLNPTKISGACGRLLCCLGYEEQNYSAFKKRCPKIGKNFSTGVGRVKVIRANMFRDALVVITETGEEREISLEEWEAIRSSEEQDRDLMPSVEKTGAEPRTENAQKEKPRQVAPESLQAPRNKEPQSRKPKKKRKPPQKQGQPKAKSSGGRKRNKPKKKSPGS